MSYDETIFAVEVKLFPRKLNGYRMEYAIINACLRYNSGMIWIIEHCDLLRRGNGWQLRLPPVCIETGSGFVMVPQWLPSAYSGLSEQPFRGKVNADSVFI